MQNIYLLPTPDNKFYVEVVGESKTQKAIKNIVAYKIMVDKEDLEHHDLRLIAHLILDNDNKFDPGNAVRVDIDNQPVGYLSAVDAGRYRKALSKASLNDVVGICRASAHGKRQGDGDKMVYGIWLSFNLDRIEVAEGSQVLHPKKKGCGLFTIPLFIAFIFIVSLVFSSY